MKSSIIAVRNSVRFLLSCVGALRVCVCDDHLCERMQVCMLLACVQDEMCVLFAVCHVWYVMHVMCVVFEHVFYVCHMCVMCVCVYV